MKNQQRSENRKALPKFFGILLLGGLIGGIVGGIAGFTGSTSLPDKITGCIQSVLTTITPWSILVFSILFLGLGTWQYCSARKIFQAWDGEAEEPIEKAEEKLCFGLLFAGLNMIIDFFFFGIGSHIVNAGNALLFLSFILSMAGIVFLQQKIVDLTRKINPEKQGSIYDMKFQKKWLASCDENEQRQLGQAAFQAFRVICNTCIVLWAVLVILSFIFDIGVLPIFLVMLIFGIAQTVYTLECIRISRHKQ